MIEKRSPGWLRVLEILAGVLVLAVAFFVLGRHLWAIFRALVSGDQYWRRNNCPRPRNRCNNRPANRHRLSHPSRRLRTPSCRDRGNRSSRLCKAPTCLDTRTDWRSRGFDRHSLRFRNPRLVPGSTQLGPHNGDSVGCGWSSGHCPWDIRTSSGQNRSWCRDQSLDFLRNV